MQDDTSLEPIAERRLNIVGEPGRMVTVTIGKPVQKGDMEWGCPVDVLEPRPPLRSHGLKTMSRLCTSRALRLNKSSPSAPCRAGSAAITALWRRRANNLLDNAILIASRYERQLLQSGDKMIRSVSLHSAALSLLVAVGSTACAAEDAVDAQQEDLSECAGTVEIDPVPSGNGRVTPQRVAALDDYADRKLRARQCEINATLKRRGVYREDAPGVADIYRVEVGNEETCLNGHLLFAKFDLESDKRYAGMKQQVDMTVEFLKRLHEDTDGVRTKVFDRVTLCPKELAGDKFILSGPNLQVNPRFSQLGGVQTMDARELRENEWDKGEHLNRFPEARALKKIWPLFDPAGTARYALRSGISGWATDLSTRLVALRSRLTGEELAVDSAKRQLKGLVRDNVTPGAKASDGTALADMASAVIDGAERDRLACIAGQWAAPLADPARWTAASEAAVATLYKQAARNALDVNVKQRGLVVVGNTHFINVDLDVFLSSGYQKLERYVEVVESRQRIDWEQTGFVVVYTVDNVEVNVNVSALRALPSAELERALDAC